MHPDENKKWTELLKLLSDGHEFKTERCMKPHNVVGLPQLHIFSDGVKVDLDHVSSFDGQWTMELLNTVL